MEPLSDGSLGKARVKQLPDIFDEAARLFNICNACRYCEGFCSVFPAMELKTSFDKREVSYLANLCHDCRDCFYACPYSPPHSFNVNIPLVLSEVRFKTYEEHTRPKFLKALFEKQERFSSLTVIVSVLLSFSIAILITGQALIVAHLEPGSFYDIFPYTLLIAGGAVLGTYVLIIFAKGIFDFSASILGSFDGVSNARAIWSALVESLAHKWFRGGGAGCTHQSSPPSHTPSYTFLIQHSLILFGFLAALLSTISAGVYQDIFGILPPYPIISVPVVLGVLGGVGIIIGTSTILFEKRSTDKTPSFKPMTRLDYS
ncbi:MAG: hypothetical protein OK457_03685, partial [Thaumarchaeota archaeon]|nr:hypothetical protein [Nitrososphaerota archaeon]